MKNKFSVIGAGAIGIAVAYELVKNENLPIIFEADNPIGGVAATFNFEYLKMERYCHFVCFSGKGFLKILDELNLFHKIEIKNGFL